jgi:hypothetical protein
MYRIYLSLAIICIVAFPTQAQQNTRRRSQNCIAIGRENQPRGQQICLGLSNAIHTNEIFCYSTARLIPIVGGKLAEQCLPPRQRVSDGHRGSLKILRKTRSKEAVNQLFLYQPFGSVIDNNRPDFKWRPAQGITNYQVRVVPAGGQPLWFGQSQGTTLSYPPGKPPLTPGVVYTVVVEGANPSAKILQDSKVLIILAPDQQQKIQAAKDLIQNFSLTPDEEALDLELMYRNHRLQQASIELLEARINSGSTNPEIYRILGDLYLEEGLIAEAKESYQTSMRYAAEQNRGDIVSKVRAALLALDDATAVQIPPSSTKGAQ